MWEIEYYETSNKECPAYTFISSLPVKMKAKAAQELALLEELGTQIREPYSKPIQDGLFELRIRVASDISRVFYFFCVGNQIILTNGFVKKAQKTP